MRGVVIACAFVVASAAGGSELMSLKDFLKAHLGAYPKLTKESFTLSADQKKALKAIASDSADTGFTMYFGKNTQGNLEKSCLPISQEGKEGPITLGVCFSPAGLVSAVSLLNYQEDRGKAVKEEAFLSQFKGKKISSAFQVGADIDGVSGATHSSKSVSEAVRKASYAYKSFVTEKHP